MATIIPQSFYETYLTSAISAAATTIPVAVCPATGVTTGFLRIEDEIIKFEGNSNPGGAGNITSVTRGLALSGLAETTAGLGVGHQAGIAVKMTDVHYYLNNANANQSITTTGSPVANDFAKFNSATVLEGRSYAETKSDLSLGNVEDTALSTWAGTSNILTVGTIGTGTWQGGVVTATYLPDASATAQGVSELAVASEIDTGTDCDRTMPVDQFVASKRNIRWLVFNLVAAATDTATATNIAGDFVSPIAGTILQSDTTPFYLYATNSTAGTTGTMVVDISIGGTSIMTTNKLDFDTTEKTTTTAETPPDLTTTSLAVGNIITIDIDAIHTTAAKGLTVYLAVRE